MAAAIILTTPFGGSFSRGKKGFGQEEFPYQIPYGNSEHEIDEYMLENDHLF